MIRVALDYRPALYGRSGIARSVRELVRALAAWPEIDLHLFGHGFRSTQAAPPVHGRLHRVRLPGRALPALAKVGIDAARLAGGAEIFHWTDYVHPPVSRRGRAVVQTVHDVAFLEDTRYHGGNTRRLRRRFMAALARTDLVVCPSQATARALARHLPHHPPVRVIPFGADHASRRPAQAALGRARAAEILGTGDPYLVALGTLEPRKNHETLLDALEHLAARALRIPLLLIGGPGWESERLRARLASRAQTFPCAWLADAEDRRAMSLLAGARALVYPSSLEGFGFPPLEALSLGVPVVAGNAEALRETLGDAALFVDGRDCVALASAIRSLHADAALRARLLAAWRERAPRFRWARAARAHADAYLSLARREVAR